MSDSVPHPHLADQITDESELFRGIAEHAIDMVTIVDDTGRIAYQSPAAERTLGFAPSTMLERSISEYIHPDDLPSVLSAIEQIQSGTVTINESEYRFRHKEGHYRYLHSVAQKWSQAGVAGIIVNSRDVTDSHEANVEIEKNNELLSQVFSVSQNLLSITLPGSGEFIDVNEAWCETLGYCREDVIGRTGLDLGIWGSTQNRENLLDKFNKEGRLKNYEAHVFSRTAQEIVLLVDAQVLKVAEQPRILMSCVNVTEAKQTEEELRQAQKMEAIGQLTGGLAHDFNNLIGVTMGNAELLKDTVSDRPDAVKFAEQIVEASKKGAKLTHQLLSFSRKQTLAPETVDLLGLLQRLEPILQTSVSENIHIRIDSVPDLWPSHVDAFQLETALLNLTLNARDAMSNGGELRFHLANLTVNTATASRSDQYSNVNLDDGDYAALTVSDTGIGMALDIQSHVFEPFFTTKETGKGTGLGLSMVFGFAKQSNGAIHIESKVGIGTKMTLLLPRAAPPAYLTRISNDLAGSPEARPKGHNETILVVEDNEPLRNLVVTSLTETGYKVVAASGEEALIDALQDINQVDLLLCDVILTGPRRGPDLAQLVQRQFPNTAVLFMTGYSPTEVLGKNSHSVLSKPFTRDECARAVRLAIESANSCTASGK